MNYYYSRIRASFHGGRWFYPVALCHEIDEPLRKEQVQVIVTGASALAVVVDMGPGYTER
jgi:hypothetical protein